MKNPLLSTVMFAVPLPLGFMSNTTLLKTSAPKIVKLPSKGMLMVTSLHNTVVEEGITQLPLAGGLHGSVEACGSHQ